MLERQGYKSLLLTPARQAWTSAKNEKPDLVVLDLMMPDIDGSDHRPPVAH
jgi:DNA-binding response OmpR family regulator